MLPTELKGAFTHNLAGVDLRLEPGQLVVLTGVSGAGKSSLAMDTLYAEGQRRFVESFSPYARQFLERLERPPITSLEPVPAGIAVDRRAPVKSSRSTVATMADLEPYLAALFVREAVPVCPEHDREACELDAESAARGASEGLEGKRGILTYPLRAHGGTEGYLELRESLIKEGYRRLWLGGEVRDIDQVKPSSVLAVGGMLEVVVDRVQLGTKDEKRVATALEEAWRRGGGLAKVHVGEEARALRRGLSCPECSRELQPARPGSFSYDSPVGACAQCRGFGRTIGVDLAKVIPDAQKTLQKRAIRPWAGKSTGWERGQLEKLCQRHGVPTDVPWKDLSARDRKVVLEGDGGWKKGTFPGVMGWFRWLETRTYKMHVRVLLSRYRSYDMCRVCSGKRLNETALAYRVAKKSIADWHALEVGVARDELKRLVTRSGQGELAKRELGTRLEYLVRVGLGYLTLDRQARTLSGGEAQRVTLTAALGTSLHNALFVLDEPTVGLHPADVEPLTEILSELAQRHNTVLVVEHDPAIVRAADRIIELGPGAGSKGGRIVADGSPEEVARTGGATARALRGVDASRREPRQARSKLSVRHATANNLSGVSVDIPLRVLCAVTGPSGSGKSTLAVDVVYRALARRLGDYDVELPGPHQGIDGAEAIRRIGLVDQAPLGRTSRGNAATYTKAWDAIRKQFASEPDAQARQIGAAHFSFNVDAGRCTTCSGEGYETVEMQFLADVRLICPVCQGRRFQESVLSIHHRGKNISEVLDLTVDETLALFATQPAVSRALGPVQKLGLGYLRIGQPLSTLSGGEAQRLKLARALADEHAGSLLILDEPSAGLHADEVRHLLGALEVIIAGGGSVIVVEHDLSLIARSDWVIDLGPLAGSSGGQVVAEGTPHELAKRPTRTGQALARHFTGEVLPRVRKAPDSPAMRSLRVVRAREHNLRDVDVEIPHGALTVVTGPSGSGKSTLAFDVVFAEGQRRFLETLTPYARQFLPTMPRPDVDSVTGVPPSIALEQRTSRAGGLSTVATVTEVAHYLRLLFAKLGTPHCPDHGEPIASQSVESMLDKARAHKGAFSLLAPVVRARKGIYLDLFTAAARQGIERAWCDEKLVLTDDPPRLAKTREHTIDLVIEELKHGKTLSRESFERALGWGNGSVKLKGARSEILLSQKSACPRCGFSVPELDPRWFSFNTQQGRCEWCEGAGVVEGPRKRRKRGERDEPSFVPCEECEGSRLAPVPRAVRLGGQRYHEVVQRSVTLALALVRSWRFSGDQKKIGEPVLVELTRRLEFLQSVGLEYLSLDRAAKTLSGGEMQRLRLAAQLGAGLTGALYVLDEPTIGLHPRDTQRLLGNLRDLVNIGSTVLVVEHDADTIRAADHLVDLGPGGGSHGGRVMAAGSARQVLADPASPTGRALANPVPLRTPLPIGRSHPCLSLSRAREHNLKDVSIQVPLARFVVVAGVSGSGKSTLVRRVLLPALREQLGLVTEEPGAFGSISGEGTLERAVAVDQSPIGRTPRSVPATFLGIWDPIRRLFASTPDAKIAGYGPSRFSFNTPSGGRCTACAGAGVITHEMSFLPDVISVCQACSGKRFEPRTLDVRHAGLSIGDVLELTAEEAIEFFTNHPHIAAPLRTLTDLGAGYIHLGQGSHTLSGGEAQRLKLAAELTASTRHLPTLYVLDEPTTGLHLADVSKLVNVLGRLVDRGDTLVVIEHHPVVIAGADTVIELGPEGGERGGRVVAEGPPGLVAKKQTPTGVVLRRLFSPGETPVKSRPARERRAVASTS